VFSPPVECLSGLQYLCGGVDKLSHFVPAYKVITFAVIDICAEFLRAGGYPLPCVAVIHKPVNNSLLEFVVNSKFFVHFSNLQKIFVLPQKGLFENVFSSRSNSKTADFPKRGFRVILRNLTLRNSVFERACCPRAGSRARGGAVIGGARLPRAAWRRGCQPVDTVLGAPPRVLKIPVWHFLCGYQSALRRDMSNG
jgi:hypothetical protein